MIGPAASAQMQIMKKCEGEGEGELMNKADATCFSACKASSCQEVVGQGTQSTACCP
jgi:hypothetical protein